VRDAKRLREQRHFAALELHQLDQRPEPLHRLDDRNDHRAADAHREIQARRLLMRRVHVVDQVDAADERNPLVDVAELAVHSSQPMRAELPRRDLRPIFQQPHPAGAQAPFETLGQVVPRAPAVDEHAHLDAALRRADERIGNRAARRIVGEDVGFEPDFALGRVDGRRQRRKELAAVAQQVDPIARREANHGEIRG
jgi:hypothetical protein